MNVLNLTPHEVVVFDGDGQSVVRRYAPSGHVVRLGTVQSEWGEVDGIPAITQTFGAVEGWPDKTVDEARIYIVPLLALPALEGMDDGIYVAPDTGPGSVVRDESGRIIGVRRFVVAA